MKKIRYENRQDPFLIVVFGGWYDLVDES